MDYKFLFIQLISVVAWFFIVLSYYRENTNKILVFQIITNLTFCIHYLLLGAFSSFLIFGIEDIIKGFTMDDERLKNLGGGKYFY